MEKIAFIIGESLIYWSPVILTIAAFAAACMFLALHIGVCGKTTGAFLTLPLAAALAMVLGRLVHWYCQPDAYGSFTAAMTDHSAGSYALAGVFAGCVLAACAMRLVGLVRNLPQTLDCMALAGCLGIGVGRLSFLFNSFDRGMVVRSIKTLPLVYPVTDAVSGGVEYRLATFMLQAIVAITLFAVLTVFFLLTREKGNWGDTCLLFLLLYGASQIVLDSTRYDSLFLRSIGFVSLEQLLGAVGMVLAVVQFSVRLVRSRGWKWWYITFWVGIGGLLTVAGFMEYLVRRHGNEAARFYHIMTACLAASVIITVVIRCVSHRYSKECLLFGDKQKRAGKMEEKHWGE